MIYLPTEYVDNCNVINNGYIRSYTNQSRTEWVDIYINQDYMLKFGSNQFGSNVVCDNINQYTDEVFYRKDFADILIIFVIMCIFCFYIPLKVFLRLFRRFL